MRQTMLRAGRRVAVPLVMVATLLGSAPRAQANDKQKALSKISFERAELLYRQARFRQALRAYSKAMSYYRHPAYLFNMAQCHRNLNQHVKARFFYRLFLSEAVDPPNKKEVERFIAAMDLKIAEQKRRERKRVKVTVVTKPTRAAIDIKGEKVKAPAKPYHQRWWFWTGISVALAAVGVATYTGTQAILIQRKWDDNQGAPADDPNLLTRGKTFRTVTDVLIGVAAVSAGAAIIGAIIVARQNKKDRRRATVIPSCGATGCGVWVTGRF